MVAEPAFVEQKARLLASLRSEVLASQALPDGQGPR
jgi:hypothetical protein